MPSDPENLGVLPDEYPEESCILLARDPHTLYLTWNYPAPLRQGAMDGLFDPRVIVRLYEGSHRAREVEIALEMRSYYFNGLTPGQSYRAEVLFQSSDGRTRRIGSISPRATLPPDGPSSDTTVRFMRLPWGSPPEVAHEALETARVDEAATELLPLTDFYPRDEELPWSATRPAGGPPSTPGQLPRPVAGMPPTIAPQLLPPSPSPSPWNASGSGKGISSLQRTWSSPTSSRFGSSRPSSRSR